MTTQLITRSPRAHPVYLVDPSTQNDVGVGDPMRVAGSATTVTSTATRATGTTQYAANENWSDSVSSPVSGGYTLTDAARASGGSGVITDIIVVSGNDPATLLQGELWIYDSAVTNDNDNAAFTSSDADTLKLVGVVPFTLASTVPGSGTTSYAHIQNLGLGFTCVGTANLRYKVKTKNAYTPADSEVLTVRAKILRTD